MHIYDRMTSGEVIRATDPDYELVEEGYRRAAMVTMEMNSHYRSPEEVLSYLRSLSVRMIAPAPIQQFLHRWIGVETTALRSLGSMGWLDVTSVTFGPNRTSSSTVMPPWSRKVQPELMNTFLPIEMFLPKSVWNGSTTNAESSIPLTDRDLR